jgi:Mn-dependent DtxR family transcriptional regulator
MNKLFSRRRLRRIVELFILNNPMTWTSDQRGVPGFRSQDVAERFGCSPAYVREIRAKMRKAGLISHEPAE